MRIIGQGKRVCRLNFKFLHKSFICLIFNSNDSHVFSQSPTFQVILQDPSNPASISPASTASAAPSTGTTSNAGPSNISSGLPTTLAPSSPTTLTSSLSAQASTSAGAETAGAKARPIGIIVGASVGGFMFIMILLCLLMLYRSRRGRSQVSSIEALTIESTPTSEMAIGMGGFTRQDAPSTGGLLAEGEESGLRQMVQQMSERILMLEAQERESSDDARSWNGDEAQVPPPDYSEPGRSSLLPRPASSTSVLSFESDGGPRAI
ncbi:hypothetical protein DXG01_001501 [Tephrocybe rancida]|nr:hypothetical protein DXG01_001501 [Tephrocybe rancida]